MWPSRRLGLRAASAARWACPSATACWCGRWRTAAPAGEAGIETGDLIVAAAGNPTAGVEALYTALDTVPAPAATSSSPLVRGTDERTVTATFRSEKAA